MVPIPTVLAMFASLATLHHLALSQAVTTATATGLMTGAAAGTAAGAAATAAVTNPRGLGSLALLPLRMVNAPFYYLLGGATADRRLKQLELANAANAEAQKAFIETLKDKKLVFDGLQVNLSDNSVQSLESGLSAGGGCVPVTNPSVPSLCSIGRFEDPFNETYTIIMLNETGKQVVVSILVVIAGISFFVLLIYAFRRVVRYSLKTTKAVTKIVEEEKQKQNRENQGSGPGYSSPSPFPVISSK